MKGDRKMKLYNINKELTAADYRPLTMSLHNLSVSELQELIDNLEKAQENYWIYGNDLFVGAIGNDIRKAEIYLKFAERKQGRN